MTTLYCYKNKISGDGMTTLVNSLPTRTASNPGTFRVIYNTGESNSMTAAQITTASNKYWKPKQYNGSSWVDYTATVRGDVNGDGRVSIDDVTDLIDILLNGTGSGNADADVNTDGRVSIDDVTDLIDLLLNGNANGIELTQDDLTKLTELTKSIVPTESSKKQLRSF